MPWQHRYTCAETNVELKQKHCLSFVEEERPPLQNMYMSSRDKRSWSWILKRLMPEMTVLTKGSSNSADRPTRFGESQSDTVICSHQSHRPWTRVTALARASSNCTCHTHPLIRVEAWQLNRQASNSNKNLIFGPRCSMTPQDTGQLTAGLNILWIWSQSLVIQSQSS
jgi:hypothetical protein